jgi:hypothetical protein
MSVILHLRLPLPEMEMTMDQYILARKDVSIRSDITYYYGWNSCLEISYKDALITAHEDVACPYKNKNDHI